MRPDELAKLLTTGAAVLDVVKAIDDVAVQTKRGWDLTHWAYRSAPGSICFIEHGDDGKATRAVVAVQAPKEYRERVSKLLGPFPLPTTLVMIG